MFEVAAMKVYRPSRKIQAIFKTNRRVFVYSAALVRLIERFRQLISGANSRTEARVEQSEWSRKSTKTVEITVETEEDVIPSSYRSTGPNTKLLVPSPKESVDYKK